MPSPHWIFGPFRLDPDNAYLWHGTQARPLTPKAFDMLHYLVTHPDRLVTKDELFDALWLDTVVSEAALRVCIGELRKALGEAARAPQFIATVARRGYRGNELGRWPATMPRPRVPPRLRPLLAPWSVGRRCSAACTPPGRRRARACARCAS